MSCANGMHMLREFPVLGIKCKLEEHREERELCGRKVPNDFY